MDYAKTLLAVRSVMDWTQAKLAEELGISQRTVSSIELGKFSPSRRTVTKIMDILKEYKFIHPDNTNIYRFLEHVDALDLIPDACSKTTNLTEPSKFPEGFKSAPQPQGDPPVTLPTNEREFGRLEGEIVALEKRIRKYEMERDALVAENYVFEMENEQLKAYISGIMHGLESDRDKAELIKEIDNIKRSHGIAPYGPDPWRIIPST